MSTCSWNSLSHDPFEHIASCKGKTLITVLTSFPMDGLSTFVAYSVAILVIMFSIIPSIHYCFRVDSATLPCIGNIFCQVSTFDSPMSSALFVAVRSVRFSWSMFVPFERGNVYLQMFLGLFKILEVAIEGVIFVSLFFLFRESHLFCLVCTALTTFSVVWFLAAPMLDFSYNEKSCAVSSCFF